MPALYILDLLVGFGFVLRLAVLQIAHVGVGHRRHHDLRQVHLRLGEVEAGLVGVIEIGDVGVGDGDVRGDLFGDQLIDGELLADFGLQIVERHVAVGELLVELLFGVGRFHLVELGVDIGIDGLQAQFLRLQQHDLVGDQAAEEFQLLRFYEIGVGVFGLLADIASCTSSRAAS